jgi:hypothetical protein
MEFGSNMFVPLPRDGEPGEKGTSYRLGSSNTGSSLRGNPDGNRKNKPRKSGYVRLQLNAESEEITGLLKVQRGGPGGVLR